MNYSELCLKNKTVKILDVKNLSLSFKSNNQTTQVLKNVSFSLDQSQALGIVGESGSGKSLTVLSILKLLPKNAKLEGEKILFVNNTNERDLLSLTEKELSSIRGRNISMIF